MLVAMLIDYSRLPYWFRQVELTEFAGEKIRWAGAPSPSASLRGALLIWLFAVPWTAFALFWEISVIRLWLYQLPNGKSGPPGLGMALFGLPFVLIGLALMSAPFFAARAARRTVHVLTDKRLATVKQGRALTVESVNPRAIVKIKRKEKPDRTGTLSVDLSPYLDSDGDRTAHVETFYGIRDVHAVELLLRDVMERGRAPAGATR
ncbi:MAG: hypothetical protein ACRCYS_09770 [Beijerinckiaceae bacterium]